SPARGEGTGSNRTTLPSGSEHRLPTLPFVPQRPERLVRRRPLPEHGQDRVAGLVPGAGRGNVRGTGGLERVGWGAWFAGVGLEDSVGGGEKDLLGDVASVALPESPEVDGPALAGAAVVVEQRAAGRQLDQLDRGRVARVDLDRPGAAVAVEDEVDPEQ